MTGWKTLLSGIGSIVFGIIQIVTGNTTEGIQFILAGLAILGIGHKIEKSGK